jgi:hypothetical protein
VHEDSEALLAYIKPALFPIPLGLLERDGDLDLRDLAAFLPCFSGTETQTLPECAAADFDGDGTVGLDHFAELARTLSGPILLPDP